MIKTICIIIIKSALETLWGVLGAIGLMVGIGKISDTVKMIKNKEI